MKAVQISSSGRAQPRAVAATNAPSAAPDAAAHSRRNLLGVAGACALGLSLPEEAQAVQGLTAGRIPGLSPDPELPNVQVYVRPDGKSGGHGVGWSEIPQYQFRVPETWAEVPVSIADLGGAYPVICGSHFCNHIARQGLCIGVYDVYGTELAP